MMRTNIAVRAGCLLFALLLYGKAAGADEKIPCLIFSGASPTEKVIDLSKLNRITFGEHSLTLTSSKYPDAEEVQLLYSLFHHMEVDERVPDVISGIDETADFMQPEIAYIPDVKSLILRNATGKEYTVGIFDLKGTLIHSIRTQGETEISLQSLRPDTYIAVATDGTNHLTLKFILH